MTLILSGTDGLSDIDGSAATPAVRGTDANTGIFFGTDIIGFSEGGVEAARFNADSQFVAAAGTAALPVITTTGDTNTGIFFPAADTIAFAEGGAEIARFDSSGNLGIGKSTITAKLDVQRTSGTTEPIGRFEAAVGSYTGTSLIAANTLGPDSAYNLFSCISDSDGDAGGPFTEFSVRGDGLVFMDSGYGSAAAVYGCRAWVNFNGTGTVAIRASGNVSSITDNGTGSYAINLTTAMPDVNYACVMATKGSGGAGTPFLPLEHASLAARTTSSIAFYVIALNGATPDADTVEVVFFR
jgi:hypothetical protein